MALNLALFPVGNIDYAAVSRVANQYEMTLIPVAVDQIHLLPGIGEIFAVIHDVIIFPPGTFSTPWQREWLAEHLRLARGRLLTYDPADETLREVL